MSDDVQLPEPASDLLDAAAASAPAWLRRVTEQACRTGGVDPTPHATEIATMSDHAATRLVDDLSELLGTDVDDQRTTPLSLCRTATRAATALLGSLGVPPPARNDPFTAVDDPYGLAPAAWVDVAPELHEPGLRWGTWKAMTVLRRRREEGLR